MMPIIRTPEGVAVMVDGSPVHIRTIIGIGRNYAEHAKEQSADVPTRPLVFTKNPSSLALHTERIIIPRCCQDPRTGGEQVDYEAELGVIIGTPARDVPDHAALAHVLGYCCANDVSARWWQKEGSGGQFFRGKSFDTFCPIGPHVTPRSAVPNPQALTVTCRLNGRTMQSDSTASMLFPVSRLIADLSQGLTLNPGTLILTGTPSGVGMARKPPVYLRKGDEVEVEVEGLGVLRNAVDVEG